MSEPRDLDAVTVRRFLGTKRLSARELLQNCARRMDSVDPAVNAVVAETNPASARGKHYTSSARDAASNPFKAP